MEWFDQINIQKGHERFKCFRPIQQGVLFPTNPSILACSTQEPSHQAFSHHLWFSIETNSGLLSSHPRKRGNEMAYLTVHRGDFFSPLSLRATCVWDCNTQKSTSSQCCHVPYRPASEVSLAIVPSSSLNHCFPQFPWIPHFPSSSVFSS